MHHSDGRSDDQAREGARAPVDAVEGCAHAPAGNGPCPHCVRLARRARRLVDAQQLTYRAAAQRMRLEVSDVRALVARERDRRDLKKYKLDTIPTARVRTLLERELARQPGLTRAEVARWLGMTQSDLDRQVGYPVGKRPPQRRIGVPAASRLAIALGYAPHDIEGC